MFNPPSPFQDISTSPPNKPQEKTSPSKVTKKDRHRKIHTAKGPRDRRMRLSLDVARKFFDLQDLLAFDKASSTVQWLLNKSKSAIKEHMAKSPASNRAEMKEHLSAPPQKVLGKSRNKVKLRRTPVKAKVARECRDKARARARERTLEKTKKMMGGECGGPEEEGRREGFVEKELGLEGLEANGFDWNEIGEGDLFGEDYSWERELMECMNDRVFVGEIWEEGNVVRV